MLSVQSSKLRIKKSLQLPVLNYYLNVANAFHSVQLRQQVCSLSKAIEQGCLARELIRSQTEFNKQALVSLGSTMHVMDKKINLQHASIHQLKSSLEELDASMTGSLAGLSNELEKQAAVIDLQQKVLSQYAYSQKVQQRALKIFILIISYGISNSLVSKWVMSLFGNIVRRIWVRWRPQGNFEMLHSRCQRLMFWFSVAAWCRYLHNTSLRYFRIQQSS